MGDDDVTEILPDQQPEDNDGTPRCTVCLLMFHSKDRIPKSLLCGHSFCQECVTQLVKNIPQGPKRFLCPTCRKHCVIENILKPFDSFPTNYGLKEMLEKQESEDKGCKTHVYPCHECRKVNHEKDMNICETCKPANGTNDDSVDFMGRPTVYLICSKCIQSRHQSHSYMKWEVVSGRWKHRVLFEKFEKSAEEEEARINKLITTLKTATEATLMYKNNLQETVRQVKDNAGCIGISSILRSFVKAADDSSKFIDMTIESVERINNPMAPQYNMIGKKLFDFAKYRKVQHPEGYEQQLSNLFNELNKRTVSSGPPVETATSSAQETSGAPPQQQTANILPAPLVPPPVAPAQPGPAHIVPAPIDPAPVLPAPVDQAPVPAAPFGIIRPQAHRPILLNRIPYEPVLNPPVRQINPDQLNVVMNYYLNVAAQQQLQYFQSMNYNGRVPWREFDQARKNALDFAAHYLQVHGNRVLHRQRRLQDYFDLPFHLVNVHFPQFYGDTISGMIRRILGDIAPIPRREEVFDFFFTEPYENGVFTQNGRREISFALLQLIHIIPDGNLKNLLQQLKDNNDGQLPYRETNRREAQQIRNEPRHFPFFQPFHMHALNAANLLAQVAPNLENAQFEQLDIPNRNEIVQNHPGGANVVPQQENNNVQNRPAQIIALEDNDGDDDDVIIIEPNVIEEPNRNQVQQDQQEIEDAEILQLQQQPRNNFVFKLEDLLIEPPARATRGAKRRAEAILPAEDQVAQNRRRVQPRDASAADRNARQARAQRRRARTRNA